jgi:hypothetical protein
MANGKIWLHGEVRLSFLITLSLRERGREFGEIGLEGGGGGEDSFDYHFSWL